MAANVMTMNAPVYFCQFLYASDAVSKSWLGGVAGITDTECCKGKKSMLQANMAHKTGSKTSTTKGLSFL